ncbi:hypothetical protein FQZ97_1054700 [compost metagenome]
MRDGKIPSRAITKLVPRKGLRIPRGWLLPVTPMLIPGRSPSTLILKGASVVLAASVEYRVPARPLAAMGPSTVVGPGLAWLALVFAAGTATVPDAVMEVLEGVAM